VLNLPSYSKELFFTEKDYKLKVYLIPIADIFIMRQLTNQDNFQPSK